MHEKGSVNLMNENLDLRLGFVLSFRAHCHSPSLSFGLFSLLLLLHFALNLRVFFTACSFCELRILCFFFVFSFLCLLFGVSLLPLFRSLAVCFFFSTLWVIFYLFYFIPNAHHTNVFAIFYFNVVLTYCFDKSVVCEIFETKYKQRPNQFEYVHI